MRVQRQGAAQEHVGAEARVPPLQEGGEGRGGRGEEEEGGGFLGLGLKCVWHELSTGRVTKQVSVWLRGHDVGKMFGILDPSPLV